VGHGVLMPKHNEECGHLACRCQRFVTFLRADRRALVASIVCVASLVVFVVATLHHY
jgi:hypothetical protein